MGVSAEPIITVTLPATGLEVGKEREREARAMFPDSIIGAEEDGEDRREGQ